MYICLWQTYKQPCKATEWHVHLFMEHINPLTCWFVLLLLLLLVFFFFAFLDPSAWGGWHTPRCHHHTSFIHKILSGVVITPWPRQESLSLLSAVWVLTSCDTRKSNTCHSENRTRCNSATCQHHHRWWCCIMGWMALGAVILQQLPQGTTHKSHCWNTKHCCLRC